MWWRLVGRFGLLAVGVTVMLIVLLIAFTQQTNPIQGRLTYAEFDSTSFRIRQLRGHRQSALVENRLAFELIDAVNLRLEWSPDGTQMAFLNLASPERPFNQLQLYDAQRNTSEMLVEFPDESKSVAWSWSSDSQRLAYTDSSSIITILTPDAPETDPIKFNLRDYDLPIALVYSPLWSPTDPNLLAVWGIDPSRRSYILLLDVERGTVQRLMTGSVVVGDLSWSRDGRHLLYNLPPKLNFTYRVGATYYLLDINTRRRRELSGSDESIRQAAWSPDGRMIALIGSSNDFIRLVDPVAGRVIQEIPISIDAPLNEITWSSDSRLLIFNTITRRICNLYAMDIHTRYTLLINSSIAETCVTPPVWSHR